ncbi:dTDP-4-dehydrorhamnose reductase [Janthinobacterium sp. KBS0711]|uniref:dTDP-4-dehydrorhamnose reductase family protein n=1 Tax=unclassified Janthinobacterium TaxID=2610881 RepID=UPI000627FE1E|nr:MULTISPECIES: SDR family oxidoreductase [unclassified Janthinobacterium]KKO61596.1 dTDP-4-dehydrorhamnose reductase [Janthinobacterium sp. KBS0711]TSD73788.1 SDR family oxidoreductase [Janthinobacterium sp. KBS0711]
MKVLVLGVSGMLGNTVLRYFSDDSRYQVFGSARSASVRKAFPPALAERIVVGTDVDNADSLAWLFGKVQPDVVINCIGLVKQLAESNDPLQAIPINSLLPHRLARLCAIAGARLVHVSTDCVFAGTRGGYTEAEASDATDLYGRSKYLGEVNYEHCITLRTSIIGHELNSANGLVGWFLAQQGSVKGYTQAIFSGLPTIELAHVIRDIVLPQPQLHGLYHVASQPINKFDLLTLVKKEYKKDIAIVADEKLKIDRSLNADRFREATGYIAPAWPELVEKMANFK